MKTLGIALLSSLLLWSIGPAVRAEESSVEIEGKLKAQSKKDDHLLLFDQVTTTKHALLLLLEEGRTPEEVRLITQIDLSVLYMWQKDFEKKLITSPAATDKKAVLEEFIKDKTQKKDKILITVLGAAGNQYSEEINRPEGKPKDKPECKPGGKSEGKPECSFDFAEYQATAHYLVYQAIADVKKAKGVNLDKAFDNVKVILIYKKPTSSSTVSDQDKKNQFFTVMKKLEWEASPLAFWYQFDHWGLHRRRVTEPYKPHWFAHATPGAQLVAIHIAAPGAGENVAFNYAKSIIEAVGKAFSTFGAAAAGAAAGG